MNITDIVNVKTASWMDLLGNDEMALSKAFAYTIANDRNALFCFLRFISKKDKETLTKFENTEANYKSTFIQTEVIHKTKDENHRFDRTDIEIINTNQFQVIIESKVRRNMLKQADSTINETQRTKYTSYFNKNASIKIMCFITQERDSNIEMREGIRFVYLSWLDIVNSFDQTGIREEQTTQKFVRYSMKNFKLNELKEILIQDMSDETEIRRFTEFRVYRRNQTFGSPLYFAPYITKKAEGEIEGIKYLSKILGILTLVRNDVNKFRNDLLDFCSDNDSNKDAIVSKWIEGVNQESEIEKKHPNEKFTYYFLSEPVILPIPLVKNNETKKNKFLFNQIPKNYCVSFKDFIERVVEMKR